MEAPLETTPNMKNSSPVVVKWSFVFGIMLLANLFVAYLVQALYPTPEYENFCSMDISAKLIESEGVCREIRGQWNADQSGMNPNGGYCDATVECRGKYEAATALHDRNVFVVFVVFGALLLAASAYLGVAEVIALGLSFAGVLALVIGSFWHWSTMQEWLRVIVLGVALLAVIVIAARKFKA